MALVGVISTQVWYRSFVGRGPSAYPPEAGEPKVKIDRLRQAEEVAA